MALRSHRLPRFWLALTLGLVGAAAGGAWWWESQLPVRLEKAADQGRYDDCLRYADQLEALRWMSGRSPREQGRCRRLRAEQLWESARYGEALKLQLLLVNSAAVSPDDRLQLRSWQEDLQTRALERFEAGDLEGALTLLRPMGEHQRPDGTALGDSLRSYWSRNKLQQERAGKLVAEQRWWEALDALNRIDHPWWKESSSALRKQVDTAIAGLRSKEQEHHSHGQALPDSVPIAALDAAVQKHLAGGLDEWEAFNKACLDLGGTVVEAGPETTCRR